MPIPRPLLPRLAVVPLACMLAIAAPADATRVYRWTDRDGVVHYGDRAPDPRQRALARDLMVIPVRAEPMAAARLRLESDGPRTLAWADNMLAGPIEVLLQPGRGANLVGAPDLPARATVKANASTLVSVLSAADPRQEGHSELQLLAIPGDPNARPRDVVYQLPLRQRTQRIDQGFAGRFSHGDPQNLYAVDFAADVGTPVLAAREGVVMQVENDFDKAGLNLEKYGGRANFVRIVHEDGTMALYAHLREGGVLVRNGQHVRAGQQIGLSGNTGFTTGPHLHFAVQVNRGMQLLSIPFRMDGPAGAMQFGTARQPPRPPAGQAAHGLRPTAPALERPL